MMLYHRLDKVTYHADVSFHEIFFNFMIHLIEIGILEFLSSKDIFYFSMAHKELHETITKHLNNVRIFNPSTKWSKKQSECFFSMEHMTPSFLMHIDHKKCIFCHKTWYTYKNPVIRTQWYAHEICIRKNMIEDITGDIVLPVYSSLLSPSCSAVRYSVSIPSNAF